MADVNVNLSFTADTSKAKAQLQDLQNTLNKLVMNQGGNQDAFGLSSSIQKATQAAAQLKATLSSATNVNTGQLDLTKFSQALQSSGMSLKQYKVELEKLGPSGAQAFAQLSKSIMNAQVPINTVNTKMKEFAVTLRNTAKWQISSSLLHGFMGAIQSAYGYAQDLNESLNNIRIVTGYGVDKMSQFAAEANKAAKALSTTTTNYTDASLIYYQQGLGDKEVKERTDVTIKLANVARESATTVSDQMTAVWNNFDDGSKSLEYYADVITKLGAATAASNSEIAEGIEKFSAISKTVGLSYEYATSALTTVVDRTRQSADVVGTAFKTMFARIQGLKLGETLEDGTTLNQYSQALQSVGINIKESNGELKDMDVILDEMGAKWKDLNRDEQVALAQKVAGVRQYQQLVSLMENYDFFKENVDLARNSEGALQEQADIYAESWEAARKRVKASLEGLYSTILNDDFFIKLNNGFSGAIDLISKFIKALGGVKAILMAIGGIAVQVFSKDIASTVQNLSLGLTAKTRMANQQAISTNLKTQATELTGQIAFDKATNEGVAQGAAYQAQAEMQTTLINNAKDYDEVAKNTLNILMDQVNALHEAAVASAKNLDQAEAQYKNLQKTLEVQRQVAQLKNNSTFTPLDKETTDRIGKANTSMGKMLGVSNQLHKSMQTWGQGVRFTKEEYGKLLDQMKESANEVGKAYGTDAIKDFSEAINNAENALSDMGKGKDFSTKNSENVDKLRASFEAVGTAVDDLDQKVQVQTESFIQDIDTQTDAGQRNANITREMVDAARERGQAEIEASSSSEKATVSLKQQGEAAENLRNKHTELVDKISMSAQVIMSFSMIASTLTGIIDTLSNPDLSGLDKFKSVLMSIVGATPMVLMSVKTISSMIEAEGLKAQLSWGWIGIALAAASALVIVGISIYQKISNVQSETEKKITKLKKEIEDLEESSEKVKNEIEDIKNAINGYDEAVEKLNACTRGTDEWYQALKEVNNIILELLGKYPELAKMEGIFGVDPNTGLRTINRDAVEEYIEGKENSANALDVAKIYKENQLNQESLNNKKESLTTEEGASINDLIPTVNGIKELFLNSFSDLANLTEEEFRNKATELFSPLAGENVIDSLVDRMLLFQDGIDSLAAESENVAEQIKTSNELIAQANIDFTEEDYQKGMAGAISSIVGSQTQGIIKDTEDKIIQDIQKYRGESNAKNSDQFKKYIADFSELTGVEYTLGKNAWRNNGKQIGLQVQGGDGKDKVFDTDYIASIIAAKNALEDLGAAANDARDTLNNIKTGNEDLDKDLYNYIASGNMGDVSKKNLIDLRSATSDDSKIKSLFGGDEAFEKYANAKFGDEEDPVQAALEHFKTAIHNASDGMGDAFRELTGIVRRQVNTLTENVREELSENESKQLTGLVQKAYENNGREASQSVVELFNTFGENADEVLRILNSADFDLVTASTQDYANAIEAAGLTGKVTAEQLKELAEAIKGVGDIPSLESLQNAYAEKSKITDGLNYGDTLSKDDWKTLDLSPELVSEYFIEMADGTHKLIGDAEEFKNKMDQIHLEPFYNKLNEINKELGKYQGFEKSEEYETLRHNAGSVVENENVNSQSFAATQLEYLKGANYQAENFDIGQLSDTIASETDPEKLKQAYDQIAEAIKNCGDQSELFKQKQLENEAEAESLRQILDQQKAQDIIDDSGLDEESVRNVADAFQEMYEALSLNEEQATRAAVKYMKLQDAIIDLNDHTTDYKKVLKDLKDSSNSVSKSLVQNSDNYKKLRKSMAGLLGVSEDLVDADFLGQLDPKELEKAAKGDQKAIERIRDSFASIKTGLPVSEIQNFKKQLEGLEEGATIPIDVLNDTALGKFIQTQIAAATTEADLRERLSGIPIDFDIIEMEGTLAEAEKMAADTGGVLADNLSMEAEINPASNVENDKQEDIAFDESYSPGTPVTQSHEVLEEGATTLGTVTSTYVPMVKNVKFNKVTENSTKETSADSVNVKTGGGKEGKVGKHTIVKPKKALNTGSVAPSTTNAVTCFVAGTLISKATGFETIENIKIGDIVLSYNEQTHQNEYSEVLQTMIHITKEPIYKLFIEKDILEVTGIHRFFVKRNKKSQWISAQELIINDEVLFANHTWHKILNIEIDERYETVYNFEVANNHNYYVGKNQILAHNKGGSCFIAGTKVSLGQSFKNIEDIKINDIVLSYNEQTHKNEYSKVLQTMIHYVNEEIYDLYIEDEILSVTGIHRFYIKQNDFIQWIAAENLQIGDNVLLANGTWHEIKDIKVSVQLTTVYNFEVANNHNYYVGKNQILAHNKGGGSGGGKSTPAKKADYTKKSEVVDRYKKLEDRQNTINKSLTKYDKLADQAYGTGKLKAMNKILKAKQQELDIQKSLIKEAEHYLKIDQNDLKKVFVENGAQTARFDKDGNITNIENIMTAMYEHLHKLEVKYNSFATQEDQKEYEESTLQPYRENIKRVKDATTQYYDTKNYLDDAKEKYLDLQFEYISKKLEKTNYKINLKLDFKQSEIEQFERELEKLENQAFSTAKRLQLLTAEVSNYAATNSLAKKGVKNILQTAIYKEVDGEIVYFNDWMKKKKWDSDTRKDFYSDLMNYDKGDKSTRLKKWKTPENFFEEWDITDEGIQALTDYRSTLIDARTALDDIKEKVDNEVLTVIDRWTKALEKSERQMEHWSNVIDKYSDIIEQVGPKALYGNQASEKMAAFRQTEMDTTLQQLAAHKSTYDTSLETYDVTGELVRSVRKTIAKENQKDYESLLKTTIGKKSGITDPTYDIKKYQRDLPQLLAAREEVEDLRLSLLAQEDYLSGDELIANLEKQKKAASQLDKFDRYYQNIEERNSELDTLVDTMDSALDKVHEERELMLDDLLKFLQLAQEDALARTNDAFTEFEKRITGMYQNIANIKEAFDLNKRLSEEYLQDYERVYELTKLNRNLEQKMDETSNIKAKEKLAQLQEKITRYAAEGVKMSRYDLEYMQKEYDLEVAKIALEEAQNAKSQVRLTRDAEGNYSYTYTADENQTAQAEQNYEDKMNDLLKLSNEYSERMLQEQLNMTEQMEESLRELAEQRIQGVITQEEYNKKAADIEAWWTEQYAYFASEREKASHNNMKVFMEDYDTYYSMEDKKIQVTRQFNDDLIKSYDEVYKEYEEAQIKRDTALDKLNKSYASGAIGLQEYLDQFKQINKDYATETQTAEAQYREIMETAVKGNAANAASIKDGFNGIILDAESTFLPQHGATWKSAIEDVETFTNALIGEVSGDGQPAKNSLIGSVDNAMTTYSKNVSLAMEKIGKEIDVSDPKNGWTVLANLIEKETTRASDKIASLATTMHTTNEKAEIEIRESVKKTKTWYRTTYPKLEATKKKLDETITTINNLIAAEAGVEPFTFKADTTAAADDVASLTNRLNKLKEASDAAEDPVKPDVDTQKAGDNVKGLKGNYDDLNKSGKDAGKTVNPKADTKGASTNVKNLKGAYDNLNKSSATAAKTVKMKADTATAKKNVDALTQSYKNLQAAQQKAGSSGDGGGSGGGTGIRDLTNKEATLIAAAIQEDPGAKYGVNPYRTKNLTSKVGAANAKKVQDILDDWYAKGGSPYASKQAEKYDADLRRKYWMDNVVKTLGFDTGGYTGKWGADGRFALLHEKELVLNKQDTENMLAAVKTVREIAAMVDLQAQNANLARQYALNIGQLSGSLAAQALNQNVHITAEFPNVQDHNEIEMAISSLVNRAAQFSYHN